MNHIRSDFNSSKKKFFGVCDKVRALSDENEQRWHIMMDNRKPIKFNTFIHNVDMSKMLDDDETPEQYIKDAKRSDPETKTYISNWGNEQVMFLQTAGFEFIFK